MGADQNFFRNSNRRSISQNHHKPSRVLGEIWNSYGRANPTQNIPRSCERNHGSERENLQTWQTWTGQTALSDRSDWSGWSLKSQTGFRDRSDRLHPDISQTKLQTANLEQTKSKSSETWRIASQLPREHIPKRLTDREKLREDQRELGFSQEPKNPIRENLRFLRVWH